MVELRKAICKFSSGTSLATFVNLIMNGSMQVASRDDAANAIPE